MSATARPVSPKIGIWYRQDTGHIHMTVEGHGFSTVNKDPASKRGNPHLYRKLAKALRDAGAKHPALKDELDGQGTVHSGRAARFFLLRNAVYFRFLNQTRGGSTSATGVGFTRLNWLLSANSASRLIINCSASSDLESNGADRWRRAWCSRWVQC